MVCISLSSWLGSPHLHQPNSIEIPRHPPAMNEHTQALSGTPRVVKTMKYLTDGEGLSEGYLELLDSGMNTLVCVLSEYNYEYLTYSPIY